MAMDTGVVDFKKFRTETFVDIFSFFKNQLYVSLLDSNLNTITKYDINSDPPLWMIGGGDAINYYSLESEKTPTKDLDCKLLFVGEYSISNDFGANMPADILNLYNIIISQVLPDNSPNPEREHYKDIFTNKGFDCNRADELDAKIAGYKDLFFRYLQQSTISSTIERNFIIGYESRKIVLSSMLNTDFTGGNVKELVLIEDKPTKIIKSVGISELLDRDYIRSQSDDWYIENTELGDGGIREIKFKMFVFKRPFISFGQSKTAFPYAPPFNSKTTKQFGYTRITDVKLNEIRESLDCFYSKSDAERSHIFDIYYHSVAMMYINRNLWSLNSACILMEDNGNKWFMSEGVLDLWIEYGSSYHPMGKNLFENRQFDGSISSIIKNIDYCGRKSVIRIPTLNWLIYDQSRMLYHSLRLQNSDHSAWTDKGVGAWMPMDDGRQAKYFKKLKGMLRSYLSIIDTVEQEYETNYEAFKTILVACNDDSQCSPSHFMTFLYETITKNTLWNPDKSICLLPPGRGKRKKSTKRKRTRRKNK